MDDKPQTFSGSPKRKTPKLVWVVGVAVALLLAGAAFYAYNMQQSDSQEIQDIINDPRKVEEKFRDIDAAAFNGDVDGAYVEIDKLIDAQDDPREKSYLLIDKSLLAENYGSPEDAETAALQAYDVNQNLATTSRLAQVYELTGKTEQAIEYYKKSLDFVKNLEVPGASIDKNEFEAKIRELEAK